MDLNGLTKRQYLIILSALTHYYEAVKNSDGEEIEWPWPEDCPSDLEILKIRGVVAESTDD